MLREEQIKRKRLWLVVVQPRKMMNTTKMQLMKVINSDIILSLTLICI